MEALLVLYALADAAEQAEIRIQISSVLARSRARRGELPIFARECWK